jgi:hypothetical protein
MIGEDLYIKIIYFRGIKPKYLSSGLEENIETRAKSGVQSNKFKVYFCIDGKMGLGNFLCSTPNGIFFLIPVENTINISEEIERRAQ